MHTDLYGILRVGKYAGPGTIKSAYRKLSKKYHPDRNLDGKWSSEFKAVQDAYAVLGDADKKAKYDATGQVDGIDKSLSEILGCLSNIVINIMSKAAQDGPPPGQLDLMRSISQTISNSLKTLNLILIVQMQMLLLHQILIKNVWRQNVSVWI